MEWLIGIYLAIGVIKAVGRYTSSNPLEKPSWMLKRDLDPVAKAFFFTVNVIVWPFW